MPYQGVARGAGVGPGDMSPAGIGGSPGIARSGSFRRRPFFRTIPVTNFFSISGVTRDSSGTALGGATVELFRTGNNCPVASTVSDGSGNYSFALGENGGPFYLVAYLDGSPDVAGTTVNTVLAVPV